MEVEGLRGEPDCLDRAGRRGPDAGASASRDVKRPIVVLVGVAPYRPLCSERGQHVANLGCARQPDARRSKAHKEPTQLGLAAETINLIDQVFKRRDFGRQSKPTGRTPPRHALRHLEDPNVGTAPGLASRVVCMGAESTPTLAPR